MWSPKGGVGLSVTAAATAHTFAQDHGQALLVDLAGDQGAILNVDGSEQLGVLDWVRSEADSVESLLRMGRECTPGISLIGPGGAFPGPSATERDGTSAARIDLLVSALESVDRPVVVDCGVIHPKAIPSDGDLYGLRMRTVEALRRSGMSVVVSSACYLALRRAVAVTRESGPVVDIGVVVVAEPGRALEGKDVSTVLQVPLLAEVQRDPSIGRAVDAGLFARRHIRGVHGELRRIRWTPVS